MIECLGLGDAQHAEGVAIERLAFKRALDQRPCEAATDPSERGAVEIAAARAVAGELAQTFEFGAPSGVEAAPIKPARIEEPPENDQRTDLEAASQPFQCFLDGLAAYEVAP